MLLFKIKPINTFYKQFSDRYAWIYSCYLQFEKFHRAFRGAGWQKVILYIRSHSWVMVPDSFSRIQNTQTQSASVCLGRPGDLHVENVFVLTTFEPTARKKEDQKASLLGKIMHKTLKWAASPAVLICIINAQFISVTFHLVCLRDRPACSCKPLPRISSVSLWNVELYY